MKSNLVLLIALACSPAWGVTVCGGGFGSADLSDTAGLRPATSDEFRVAGAGAADVPVDSLLWMVLERESTPHLGFIDAHDRQLVIGDVEAGRNRIVDLATLRAWAPAISESWSPPHDSANDTWLDADTDIP
jgi:hypothetical protein